MFYGDWAAYDVSAHINAVLAVNKSSLSYGLSLIQNINNLYFIKFRIWERKYVAVILNLCGLHILCQNPTSQASWNKSLLEKTPSQYGYKNLIN